MLGAERKIVLTPADRERTAYHEAGHALVGMLTPGADPVRKVSIVPRGMALGVTLLGPRRRSLQLRREATCAREDPSRTRRPRRPRRSSTATITTGAENDIQQVTRDRARHGRCAGA